MLYFIPAWYKQNTWSENEQYWHVRRLHTEFDDTVKQIQLFHRNADYPYRILLLGFAPNFRHFLHRQGVYRAPYWSCFDAISEVQRTKVRMLSIHQLKWPEEIEFIYTPFVLVAMLNECKYAQVEYGEDGNPIQIELFQNNQIVRRNIYDDRGFVAATIVYENEVPVYQDYLTEKGVWKLRHFFADGHVEVNPKIPYYLLENKGQAIRKQFVQSTYGSLEQVIYEVLCSFLGLTQEKDIFCVAMHELHAGLLKQALQNRKVILSVFQNRYQFQNSELGAQFVGQVDYIITDSAETTALVRKAVGEELSNITDITPFDTRNDHGISQQLSVQKILVPVDRMSEVHFTELVRALGEYCWENDNVQICLFTRRAEYDRKTVLLDHVRKILQESGMEKGWAAENDEACVSENPVDEEMIAVKFVVEQCVEELAVSKCMKEQRILVDLRETPALYLQVMAVSLGIPQILQKENKFARSGGNCYLVNEVEKLQEALEYYLDGLVNWNEAHVYSFQLSKKYTTKVLLAKWKEVIDSIG